MLKHKLFSINYNLHKIMKALIILGCKLDGCIPTDEMIGRVNEANLFASFVIPDIVIFSGGVTSIDCQSESNAMFNLWHTRSKEKVNIFLEEKSTTTLENAIYSREILEQINFKGALYLMTSCYHISRSLVVFRTVLPNQEVHAGTCYGCKPERLRDEYNLLLRDTQMMEKIDWNSTLFLDEYKHIFNQKDTTF